MKKCVAIIPARGGSQRIKKKSIKFFCGKPIISYSIISALKSGCFDKVIVSTDSNNISKVALKYGAEVPFKRPKNLSDDKTSTGDVIKHAIHFLRKKGVIFEFVCCIYPAAPFAFPKDLILAMKKLKAGKHNLIFTACKFSHPVYRGFKILKNHEPSIIFSKSKYKFKRTQDYENIYHDAGQFYFGTASAFLRNTSIFSSNSTPIIFPTHKVQDIDTIDDWKQAEIKYHLLKKI